MSFRDIQTSSDVEIYHNRLIQGYQDRPTIVAQIIKQIEQVGLDSLTLLELCVGPGQLATALCNAFPEMTYVGLDFMQPFLDYTAEKLPSEAKASFLCADLTDADWAVPLTQKESPHFNAIVSMQSLHDVGGQDRAKKIYAQCFEMLGEKGVFINADLITQAGDEANARPGRLTVSTHLKLLKGSGFKVTDCSLQTSQFGICYGLK